MATTAFDNQLKRFTENDIQKFVLAQRNPTIIITNATLATTYNVDAFTIGSLSGYVRRPDYQGATTSNISFSGAINHIAKYFYNRYTDTYKDQSLNIYTIPRADASASACNMARLIQVSNPTKDQGIYPDTFQCTVWYNGVSAVAIDTVNDSIGINKETLNYGYLVDASQTGMKVGTIFYDYGIVLLHGGTGSVWSALYTMQTGVNYQNNYKTSFDTSLTGGGNNTIVITDMSFSTQKIIARNVFYCRANHNEFNYSSNPSAQGVEFLQRNENATTFISEIALMNDAREILAVAKLSPVVKKDFYTERVFQIILDF